MVCIVGTTGLPKGVMIMAGRHLNTARGMAEYLRLTPDDKFYTCLPLYHGAAQGLCTTPVIFAGASMRLGRKFSHKTFWPEIHQSGANRLQYVGELCRYLVNAPVHPLERSHRLQEAWGNGMRPDVWETFRQRFNIPAIHELYAATDGLGATFNRNSGEFSRNAIGLRGLLWHRNNGDREIRARIDPDTEELVRDKDGWVVKAGVNEPGEVLHKIDPLLKVASFKGYFKNEEASEKRWLRGAFQPDDLWFRSGDVMRVDADGRVFFVDRLGDTFRWRSENVSTNEVSDVMGTFEQIAECNVYGVQVPHADGRCGCAMIVPQPPATPDTLDLAALAQHVISRLPRYAVPLFLRVAAQLSYTGTFKIQKGQAKREGVDLDLIEKTGGTDRMYWLPPGGTTYVPYQRADWEALKDGKIRL
jgi:acyl-CoA synthetase (AMP-forming)/AMP-acid ligase II